MNIVAFHRGTLERLALRAPFFGLFEDDPSTPSTLFGTGPLRTSLFRISYCVMRELELDTGFRRRQSYGGQARPV